MVAIEEACATGLSERDTARTTAMPCIINEDAGTTLQCYCYIVIFLCIDEKPCTHMYKYIKDQNAVMVEAQRRIPR